VRRTSSHSALPDDNPPTARRRMLRSTSTNSSRSDIDALEQRYGGDSDEEDAENVLTALSINISPGKQRGARTPYHSGPSKRSGRHSVANDLGAGPMTLRDQEQVCPPLSESADG
jgi:hypothetical protein